MGRQQGRAEESGLVAQAALYHPFLDGSHENYDLLEQYPTEERFGGLVQPLGGNVYHVCRGSVLELEGKKYLCFGGAESPDKEEREAHVNWWPQEMPSDEEYARCEAALEANGWQVDYVLTHDAPSKFLDFSVLAEGENNRLHLFLDKVVMKTTYEKWFSAAITRMCSSLPRAAASSAM